MTAGTAAIRLHPGHLPMAGDDAARITTRPLLSPAAAMIMGWGWAWEWVKMIDSAPQLQTNTQPNARRLALSPLLVVFCAGINLILVQWILVRELTALLLGTELVT